MDASGSGHSVIFLVFLTIVIQSSCHSPESRTLRFLVASMPQNSPSIYTAHQWVFVVERKKATTMTHVAITHNSPI